MNPPKSAQILSFTEVTANNIIGLSSQFLKKVSEASYIALDLEFTGLSDSSPKDMNHRYMAYKKTVETHAMVSMGISIFKQTQECVYSCDNFHFLTLKQGSMTMDVKTGQFLLEHNFSLDRLFLEGVPFWPPSQSYSSPLNELFKGMMRLMAKRSLPLVTHNGLYDILYIYHSFIGTLPKTLAGFLKNFSNQFPSGVYDTKFLVQEQDCEASFLSYVFARFDRLRQKRFVSTTPDKPYFEVNVQDPLEPENNKRKAEGEEAGKEPAVKKQRGLDNKGSYCKQFAERGYCEFGHGTKSIYHNIETILDHQLGPSLCPVPVMEEVVKVKEGLTGGAHSSHYDAYMTAFAYCYLTHTMKQEDLEKCKNKLNIGGIDIPLTFPAPTLGRQIIPKDIQTTKEEIIKNVNAEKIFENVNLEKNVENKNKE
ncbi:Target of EGR1, member 1 (Nuclear) [Rhizopus stolonifer]|uniref:Target of EGR1, member 1 (Nuclear) n=1 Tax=Rhizopus stolonifer TaxID=4846 RepID=A0A367JMK3_RHIST|nr:Target of EGR1, member 1 (Nuclear) [Rhizopus stolonifer]